MNAFRPIALITGASSGLGAEFARALAAQGADLILAARRGDRLQALAKQLEARYSTKTEVLVIDLATDEGIETVEAKILATPDLHWLINNAGFNVKGYFHQANEDRPTPTHASWKYEQIPQEIDKLWAASTIRSSRPTGKICKNALERQVVPLEVKA